MTTILERIRGARQKARNEAEQKYLPTIFAPYPGRKVALRMGVEFADQLIDVFDEASGRQSPTDIGGQVPSSREPQTDREAALWRTLALLRRSRVALAEELQATVEHPIPQHDQNRVARHIEQLKGEITIQHSSLLDTIQHLLRQSEWHQAEKYSLDAIRRASVIERDLVSRVRR